MFFEWVLLIVLGLTLLGLVHSTESILDLRQRQRDDGHDIKTYL